MQENNNNGKTTPQKRQENLFFSSFHSTRNPTNWVPRPTSEKADDAIKDVAAMYPEYQQRLVAEFQGQGVEFSKEWGVPFNGAVLPEPFAGAVETLVRGAAEIDSKASLAGRRAILDAAHNLIANSIDDPEQRVVQTNKCSHALNVWTEKMVRGVGAALNQGISWEERTRLYGHKDNQAISL